ncbi:MAG: Hsp70 family protein, partial [Bacteriovorax sp.]|nr:Hsp70 family protein [Bacteriovorax sp.]
DEIEKAKIRLGKNISTQFDYHYPGIDIQEAITRADYQESITPTIDDIINCMMEVFEQSGLNAQDIDQVCLTGGTSQLPKIRETLSTIFGKEKLIEYNIYQSVVNGLAQYAKKLIL